ncbi:MAG: Gfo/Idh/MocA family oxidoreductase, partial [Pirellulaceae bacterium]|nr:Gfo/Idh/MocA family oxidoreductase [Pirellulaceae bacterium]
AVLSAVASRREASAQKFIDECQATVPFAKAPEAVEGYDNLLARADIDAVYIPLPTGLRKEWVLRAAAAGKHVMCEKPCGATTEDLCEMIAACREHNVQFMDGVMFNHSARLNAIRDTLDDGESIGELKRIATHFSFRAPDDFLAGNIRVHSDLEPMGCLGDLGWYNIRIALWIMNYRQPLRVSGRLLSDLGRDDSPQTVPTEFSGELLFEGGVSAGFYCSFLTEHQQWVHASGVKGNLSVRDFVLPSYGFESKYDVTTAQFQIDGCNFHMHDHTRTIAVPEYSDGMPNAQETNLFRNFSDLALSDEPDDHWPDIALLTQRVMDACHASAMQDGAAVELG